VGPAVWEVMEAPVVWVVEEAWAVEGAAAALVG